MSPVKTLSVALLLAGCASLEPPTNRPQVDLSRLECGYQWFQTGYSEYVPIACGTQSGHLAADLLTDATAHAWEVAILRCGQACPPVELKDKVEWDNPHKDGVCRDSRIYFLTRVFFRCGPQPQL